MLVIARVGAEQRVVRALRARDGLVGLHQGLALDRDLLVLGQSASRRFLEGERKRPGLRFEEGGSGEKRRHEKNPNGRTKHRGLLSSKPPHLKGGA